MKTRLNRVSATTGIKPANDNHKKQGTVRRIDPSDERSIDHPCHKKQWLEFAKVLGRLEAREEYAMIHNNDERQNYGKAENRSRI
jgi:hypothetical protein